MKWRKKDPVDGRKWKLEWDIHTEEEDKKAGKSEEARTIEIFQEVADKLV